MFFIASHFQLPPVSERFHGNYRQPQQSGSHRSDHKVTPADTCTYNQPPAARGTRVSHSDLSFGALQFIGCCELLRFPVFRWTHTFFLWAGPHLLCGPAQNHTLLLLVILGILVLLVIYCPVIVFQHLRGHGGSLLTKLI